MFPFVAMRIPSRLCYRGPLRSLTTLVPSQQKLLREPGKLGRVLVSFQGCTTSVTDAIVRPKQNAFGPTFVGPKIGDNWLSDLGFKIDFIRIYVIGCIYFFIVLTLHILYNLSPGLLEKPSRALRKKTGIEMPSKIELKPVLS